MNIHLVSLLLFATSLCSVRPENIYVDTTQKHDMESMSIVMTNVRSYAGTIFSVYLSTVKDGKPRVTAILANYSVPNDFPDNGFSWSAKVGLSMKEEPDGKSVFEIGYKSDIESTNELSVYSIVTSSNEQRPISATAKTTTLVREIVAETFPTVSSVKLVSWEVNEQDGEQYLVELWLAYADDLSDKEFLKTVYSDVEWMMNGSLRTYPIKFHEIQQ